jgi:hypothetical protein
MGSPYSKSTTAVRSEPSALAVRMQEINERFPPIPRPCGTPGAVYSIIIDGKELGCVVTLPFNIADAIPASAKEDMKRELHDAILPIVERFYRRVWDKTIAGKTLGDDKEPMPKRWGLLFTKWMERSFERGDTPVIENRIHFSAQSLPREYWWWGQ